MTADAFPGYVDLQVNGYAGIDFQSLLTADDLHTTCAALRAHGVASILATVITAPLEQMERQLRQIVALRAADPLAGDLIAGIHIEGPFLSPVDGYRGAHSAAAMGPADRDVMNRLLDAAGGLARLVTLAPEVDAGFAVTRMLAGQGVRVSAGHTNATLDELAGAIDAGLSMFTHLGNGCPMMLPRHDNIIQRVLSLADRLWVMFIADGAHVAFPALGNYVRCAGIERCVVVTDAVAPAGKGPGRYQFGRWDIVVDDDLVVRSPDRTHLVGSAISMPVAAQRLAEHLRLTPAEIRQLTVHNPRAVLGGSGVPGRGRSNSGSSTTGIE